MAIVTCNRLLAGYADAAPDRPAITCGEQSITRAGLRDAAELLARDLAARGVQHGDMVTIALPNSIDWFVAQHAIWRVGGVPQPVSARLPQRELEAIVELANSRVVFGVEPDVLPGRTCLPIGYQPPDVMTTSKATTRLARHRRSRGGVAGVEGADVGREHRSAEADRVG